MLSLILAASTAARCALPEYCPSDEALRAMVEASTEATISALLDDADEFTSMHAPRIVRISDVYCGDFVSDDPRSITCRLTVRYPSSLSYRIVRLSKGPGGWTLEDQLGVIRRIRPRR